MYTAKEKSRGGVSCPTILTSSNLIRTNREMRANAYTMPTGTKQTIIPLVTPANVTPTL
jgi:hypothetical protein